MSLMRKCVKGENLIILYFVIKTCVKICKFKNLRTGSIDLTGPRPKSQAYVSANAYIKVTTSSTSTYPPQKLFGECIHYMAIESDAKKTWKDLSKRNTPSTLRHNKENVEFNLSNLIPSGTKSYLKLSQYLLL